MIFQRNKHTTRSAFIFSPAVLSAIALNMSFNRLPFAGPALRVELKYTFRDRSAECDVPKYVLQAIVDDMLSDIRAFFESEEGKREFEEWKAQRENKPAEGEKEHKKK